MLIVCTNRCPHCLYRGGGGALPPPPPPLSHSPFCLHLPCQLSALSHTDSTRLYSTYTNTQLLLCFLLLYCFLRKETRVILTAVNPFFFRKDSASYYFSFVISHRAPVSTEIQSFNQSILSHKVSASYSTHYIVSDRVSVCYCYYSVLFPS